MPTDKNKSSNKPNKGLSSYWRNRYLLKTLVLSDLKERYAGSFLGIYWSVINPLLMIAIYTFVFSFVLKVEFHAQRSPLDFALYLVCGMLPWFALQESVVRSAGIIEENASLVKRVNFPSSLLPIYVVVGNLITMSITLALFLIFISLRFGTLSVTLLYLPVILILQFLFTTGLSWLVSCLSVVFPDMRPLVQNFMLLWLFVTPVFYPSAIMPGKFSLLLILNPLAHMVDLYREIIMKNNLPLENLRSFALAALLILIVGRIVFSKMEERLVDYI